MTWYAATLAGDCDAGIQRPDALAFTPRKESWVAASAGWFYKIFRASDEPVRDWLDAACSARARREYADMLFLHGLSHQVCRPVRLDHACIVYPYLSGPDLREVLHRNEGTAAERASGLHAAMALLAGLHAATAGMGGYPVKDYCRDTYVRPDSGVAARLAARERTLCIGGFEVRNLRFARARRDWLFFDPQHVFMGVVEEDLARFIISLLMVNWGVKGSLRIWDGFAAQGVVASYEAASGRSVDAALLDYFLYETVAMRRHFAAKAVRAMRGPKRVLGQAYLTTYFRQLDNWVRKHEF